MTALAEVIDSFQPDYVFHLAARTDLNGKTLLDYDSNHVGTKNVAEALTQSEFCGIALFASSMYVCIPGYQPKHERDYCPHTIYGKSKVQSEAVLYELNPSFDWYIVRPTSIWGPWFGEPYKNFFDFVKSGKFLKIYASRCQRTYGFVDNAIFQMLSIISSATTTNLSTKCFYLGDRQPYEINAWADEIAKLFGRRNFSLPQSAFRIMAAIGDLVIRLGGTFPMTSFRLVNMTTDNLLDLSPLNEVCPTDPVSREEGNFITVEWILRNST